MNEFCIFLSDPNAYLCFVNSLLLLQQGNKEEQLLSLNEIFIMMHLCALFLGGVVAAVWCALVIMQNDKVYHCSDSEAWVRA